MAELLKLAHLIEEHRVPEVQVRRGRVKARLDAQRLPFFKLAQEFGLDQHFARTALDFGEL